MKMCVICQKTFEEPYIRKVNDKNICYNCKPRNKTEQIYQPEHYSFGKYECINVIKDISTKAEYEGYLRGNVVKYLWRYRHKNGIEDLMKCRHYLDMLIKEVGNCGDK